MKKAILILTFISAMGHAQQQELVPQVSVSGEGKVKVIPDQAIITVGVENTGKEALEVKKINDVTVDQVLKMIKKKGISETDFQTQRVNLYKNYDYSTKKHNYVASQTIKIHLKDLSKYDDVMMGLLDSGINQIQGVEFVSSKMDMYKVEARKKAVLDAKKKAEDYAGVLEQKVGKALTISEDGFQTILPQPMYRSVMVKDMEMGGNMETLAVGEIEVGSRINISFELK